MLSCSAVFFVLHQGIDSVGIISTSNRDPVASSPLTSHNVPSLTGPLAMAASKKASAATVALLLSLNLLFFSVVSATHVPCPPPPVKPPCGGGCTPVKPPPVKPPCGRGGCPPVHPSCPRDALKLGVCANVLNILRLKIGTPPKYPCCSLLDGLVDLEAAVCLCTALKASILGIVLNLPIDLSLLLNFCGKTVPHGFQCA